MFKKNALKFFSPNMELLKKLAIDLSSDSFKSVKKNRGEYCRLVSDSKYKKIIASAKDPIFIYENELSSTKNNIEVHTKNANAVVEIINGVTSGVRGLYIRVNNNDTVSEIWQDINCHRLLMGYKEYSLTSADHTMRFSSSPCIFNRASYSEAINDGCSIFTTMKLAVESTNNRDRTIGAVISASMLPANTALIDNDYYFDPYYLDYYANKLSQTEAVSNLITGVYTNVNTILPGMMEYLEGNDMKLISNSSKQSIHTSGTTPNIAELINSRSQLIRQKLR